MYLLGRSLNISKMPSFFMAILFALSPKYFSYLEAGHLGMIYSWAFLPWIFLSTALLLKGHNLKFLFIFLVSAYSIYVNHVFIFIYALAFNFLYILVSGAKVKPWLFAHIILFVIISPILIPQMIWSSDTTRQLLILNPEVFPVWNGKREFLSNLIVSSRDTEKNIAIGIGTLILSFAGLKKLKRKYLTIFIPTLIIILLVASNNVSPIYKFLMGQNWFLITRVSTRIWPFVLMGFILLAGKGIETLSKINKLFWIVALAAVIETASGSYFVFTKKITDLDKAPVELTNYISQDRGIFRIFCTTRCISQKQAAINNLELIEGYGTLQQNNYYRESQQLMQGFWRNRYTLSVPPFEIYMYEKLQPSAVALSKLRVKYVISPHDLTDTGLSKIKSYGKYKLYRNLLYKNPNYQIYTPNFIRVSVQGKPHELEIPEIYNRFWVARLNGIEEVEIRETGDSTRKVKIKSDTKFVDFTYEPFSKFLSFFTDSTHTVARIKNSGN